MTEFNPEQLAALANSAKARLKTQQAESPKDLYAAFREEGTTPSAPAEEETVHIEHEPNDDEYPDYALSHEPTEEDMLMDEREGINILDEPVFPGGPPLSQVQIWKKEWADCTLYILQVLDRYFITRTLNRHEYKQLIGLELDQLQREEVICETCMLFPPKYNWKVMARQEAGLPSTLASIIMEKSGFTKEYGIQIL